ncbi:50S ribosomal protein L20 [Pajaroellobacter abortibovis]|uniref:Large ribosomal subunit protein bL20 n=1 Tax=Pajaroellobacter abortibovis TaxID=1882918 RepID=A0A1L6MYL3_9BACT|nr:50S ribosomal protein L20 [Pajaroellobacter abortibovis]APS00505.1 50S ribosomal protein L20 [Pajaroellobacter abortibovis]
MPRAKRGFKARRRRNRILKLASGYQGPRSRLFAYAKEVVMKAWVYAYAHRRRKKRDFRRLWVTRINAASRANSTTYSRLLHAMKQKKILIDRKILADLAVKDPSGFAEIARLASRAI